MTTLEHIVLEVSDPAAARAFYDETFALGDLVRLRPSDAATSGFRGFTMSLVVQQPNIVDAYVSAAIKAGATHTKKPSKSFWGYGGAIKAPDGTLWTIASSSKKNAESATQRIDEVVLLLGVNDVKASKRFYVDRGIPAGKSFGGKYAELDTGEAVKLSLYPRKAAAKNVGVNREGTGSHRVIIVGSLGPFEDPDGYRWERAEQTDGSS